MGREAILKTPIHQSSFALRVGGVGASVEGDTC